MSMLDNDNHVTLEISEHFHDALHSAFGGSVVVFDLDGTLSNDAARQHLAKEQKWHEYNMASIDDPVNVSILEALQQHFQQEDFIVILTGRMWSPEVEEITVEWLNKNDIFFDAIVMRKPGNTLSNGKYKIEWHSRAAKNVEVTHAYDDNPEAIELWKELGVEAIYVQSGSPFYE